MSPSAAVKSRVLYATSNTGKAVAQALPDDDEGALRWVRFCAESLAFEAVLHPGAVWTFIVIPDTTVHDVGKADEVPLCSHCKLPVTYVRGAHVKGGVSTWVHDATGERHCADGFGHADIHPEPALLPCETEEVAS